MTATLVDSNVILDVAIQDDEWLDWSSEMLTAAAERGPVVINPIVYAEVSARYATIESLDAALPLQFYTRSPLPWEAAFLAAKAFARYRRRGGSRSRPLPDFFIGAHAAVRGYQLLTRDRSYYAAYFRTLKLISPETHP